MRRPGAADHADGRAVAGIAAPLLPAGRAGGRGPCGAAFARVRLAGHSPQPDLTFQAASDAPPQRLAAAAAAARPLREKRVGDCELAAAGARAFRCPVARPANSAAVRAPGRHRAVLAAGSARLGRLKMGRARRAQRPGGRPGVHRAGPAAPSARLLPPAPIAVTAEPAVAGAMRQLARASACQARCHDDTPIPGGGQQPGERDHRLRRVCRPGRERTGKDGQVPVELPQRAPRLEAASLTRRRAPATSRPGTAAATTPATRSRAAASVPPDAGSALTTLRDGAPRCAWPTARAVPRRPPWRPGR